MTDTKDVILNIKTNFSENIDQLAKLQKELDDLKVAELQLNAAVKSGTKTREEADKELEALAAQVRNVKTQQREYRKEIDNEIKAHEANEGSIKQLRAELANLRKEYEELSKAERDGAKGSELLTKIQSTTDELKKLEAAQGDYRRNVGNYQSALEALNPAFGKVVSGFNNLSKGTMNVGIAFKNGITQVKAFGAQLLKLLANPIVVIIAAIAAVVMKLVDAFKKNDDAMTALQTAFAAFQPIIDIFNTILEKAVNVLTKLIGGITKAVTALFSLVPAFKKSSQAAQEYVKRVDQLEEKERKYAVETAKNEAKISELRHKAADTANYSAKERIAFLEEAGELEKDNLRMELETADEEWKLAVEDAKRRKDTSDDTKKKISELETKRWNAVKNYQDGMRAITKATNKAMAEVEKELNKDLTLTEFYKTLKKMREEAEKLREELGKTTDNIDPLAGTVTAADVAAAEKKADDYYDNNYETAKENSEKIYRQWLETKKKEQSAIYQLEDLYLDSIDDTYVREYSKTKVNGEREIEELRNRLETEKNLTEKTREAIRRTIILKEADLQLTLTKMEESYKDKVLMLEETIAKNINTLKLKYLNNEDAIMQARLELNEMETKALIKNANEYLETLRKNKEETYKDSKNLADDEIWKKYSAAFKLFKITGENARENLKLLADEYESAFIKGLFTYTRFVDSIKKADEAEQKRIRADRDKNVHDEEVKQISLARKHAEIMRAIELENNYDAYGQNEIEKTRILLEQAKERQRIAEEEYSRIAGERSKHNDEWIKNTYGSLQEYNNAVEEANLKVIQSENDVKDAIKDVENASAQQKITMIENATSIMGSVNNILGSMQGLFETMAESNESYADFATAMALMQILVSTAISIANAIQGATAAGAATGAAAPFTTPVFITEMISIVAGAIASATTTLMKAQQQKKSAPKFADGGLIGGHYASSESEGRRDDVAIQASRGEYIINANAVKRYGVGFLDSINGNAANISVTKFANGGYVSDATVMAGNYQFQMDMTRQMMLEAMSEIQPVVSVREITKVQNRVTLAERISKK